MKCLYCGKEVKFVNGRGWIHVDCDSFYIMRCKNCGYQGATAVTCPNCGSKNYVDDHCALPDRQ